MRVLCRIILAVSLGLACVFSAQGPFAAAPRLTDANADGHVDVLDLQAAVAAVLSAGDNTDLTDVNLDGAVDILDLQAILDQAQTDAPAPQQSSKPLVLLPAYAAAPFHFPRTQPVFPLPDNADDEGSSNTESIALRIPEDLLEQRATGLLPHAPPRRLLFSTTTACGTRGHVVPGLH